MTDEFRIYCDEIHGSGRGMTQDLGNSRIFVIASEAKQSLGILDFLGNSRFLLAFRLDKPSSQIL